MYDVAIAGAGPSGSYLAYLLAKDGYSVLIVDKSEFPREKVCGGGISNKTLELLEFAIDAAVERRIVGAYLTYRNRDTIVKDLDGRSGVTVTREAFDTLILEHARERGACFLGGHRFLRAEVLGDCVDVSTSKGTFRARYLIGADGVFSWVRRWAFGADAVTYAPSMEALVYVSPQALDYYENRTLLDFGGMPRGYGWIFPKKDHLNVGVFSVFGSRNIRDDFDRFVGRYETLRKATRVVHRGFAIPLTNRRHVYQKGRVWLLGDAAGFAESFYGEGIFFALKSAVLAHQAMSESFSAPRIDRYSQLIRSELLPDMRYSAMNAKLFFPVQRFGFYRMVRNRHVNYYFAEIIAGRVSYKECFYKTLMTLPYWLFSGSFPYVEKRF
jgi:geranylgeranyl reductase family protein